MSIIGSMTSYAIPTDYQLGSGASSGKTDIFGKLIEDLKELAFKTPMERARDKVLEKHGVTEEQYAQMPASERDPIAKEIAEAVKRAAEAMAGRKPSDGNAARFA